jgi:hypothetical protein
MRPRLGLPGKCDENKPEAILDCCRVRRVVGRKTGVRRGRNIMLSRDLVPENKSVDLKRTRTGLFWAGVATPEHVPSRQKVTMLVQVAKDEDPLKGM